MNKYFKLSTIASAVLFTVSTTALALEPEELNMVPAPVPAATYTKNYVKTDVETHVSTSTATSNVAISKTIDITKDVDFTGTVEVEGEIDIDGAVFATINDKQANHLNISENDETQNNINIQDETLSGTAGNVGLNAAAGDNNQQDVATALTYFTDDENYMSADSEIFAYQDNEWNRTDYEDVRNEISLGAGALKGATGNVGVNLAAGNNHQQKSNMAISYVDKGIMAEANVSAEQYSDNNYTFNDATSNQVTLNGSVLSEAAGNISLNATVGTGNQQATHLSIASN